MRLRLARATFARPVGSKTTHEASRLVVLELDDEAQRVYITIGGRERFTPISNLVEAEFTPAVAERVGLGSAGIPVVIRDGRIEEAPRVAFAEAKPKRARSRRTDGGPATS